MSFLSYFRQGGASQDVVTPQKAPDIKRFLDYAALTQPDDFKSATRDKTECDSFANAPLFSIAAQTFAEKLSRRVSPSAQLVPQYGLIGSRADVSEPVRSPEDQLIMTNLNIPWSAFICGSQGAGKSHTLSCLLEACLIRDNPTGTLSHPMAGLVFHFDRFTSVSTTQICEAAYISSSGIPVRVLVTPSNVWNMNRIYGDLLGADTEHGTRAQVVPLYFNDSQLNISTLLKLMAFDPTGSSTPLYMEVVIRIIREIAMEGSHFSYSVFKDRLSTTKLFKEQETALNMRLQLLDTFLAPQLTPNLRKPSACEQDIWDFQPGTLTIVDLSDPFLSSDDACSLFSICLAIFLEERSSCGRVVALDEAHKFLTQTGAANVLTEDLTSIIRQQRHIGTRVFTATQEPTLSPKLIDLSNATFVHRFSSPAWYQTLRGHLAGAAGIGKSASPQRDADVFRAITELQTGEALVFCPTAQVCNVGDNDAVRLQSLGSQYMWVRTRKRVTFDGGVSIAATANIHAIRPFQETGEARIKMHNPVLELSAGDASKPFDTGSRLRGRDIGSQPQSQSKGQQSDAPSTSVDYTSKSSGLFGLLAAQFGGQSQSSNTSPEQGSVTWSSPSSGRTSSVATSQTSGQARVFIHKKVRVTSRAQLNGLAIRYARRLAKRGSWNHATVVNQDEREKHLEAFKTTIEPVSTTCNPTEVRMLLLGAIGALLADLRDSAR